MSVLLAVCGGSVGEAATRLGRDLGGLTCNAEALVDGIRTLVGRGDRHLTVVPISLSLAQDHGRLEVLVALANRRWPFLTIAFAAPLDWLEWAGLLADSVNEGPVVLTEASCGDSLADANLARVAALVEQASGCRVVAALPPSLDARRDELVRLGYPPSVVSLFETALASPRLVDVLAARVAAAVPPPTAARPGIPWSALAAGEEAEAQALADLDRRVNDMLPPMYQGRLDEVSPTSMGTAALRYDDEGRVAWGHMWTSFCDLALAGGPAHRGTLLEAVTAEQALADPERYATVVSEIERGLRLVTPLPILRSKVAGWVGVQCDSEAMAVWMLRAIIVENVMARREGEALYVPAGPAFRVDKEIKNVITVLAKTCHYWSAHRSAAMRGGQ